MSFLTFQPLATDTLEALTLRLGKAWDRQVQRDEHGEEFLPGTDAQEEEGPFLSPSVLDDLGNRPPPEGSEATSGAEASQERDQALTQLLSNSVLAGMAAGQDDEGRDEQAHRPAGQALQQEKPTAKRKRGRRSSSAGRVKKKPRTPAAEPSDAGKWACLAFRRKKEN